MGDFECTPGVSDAVDGVCQTAAARAIVQALPACRICILFHRGTGRVVRFRGPASRAKVAAVRRRQVDRQYPGELAGPLYPRGIPIIQEHCLEAFRRKRRFDQVVFAYSDVTRATVIHIASRALDLCDFVLLGPARTMFRASVPVIRVRNEFAELESPSLSRLVDSYLQRSSLVVCEQ